MPQPARIAQMEQPLAEAYVRAWRYVTDLEKSLADDPRLARQRRRLRELELAIRLAMNDLEPVTRMWVQTQLPQIYALGAVEVAQQLGDAFRWTQMHVDAVQRLANGMYTDLLRSTRYVNRTTKQLIRRVLADQALQKAIAGRTATQAAVEMRRVLETHEIHAIKYRNGVRMPLDAYSKMAMRTVTGMTYNEGTLNSGAERNVLYWECFDGPTCGWTEHNDTQQALGRIVTYDESLGYPLSHPNCRRSFGARPDIRTKAQAKVAKGHTTEAQRQAQLAQDRARVNR